jgi:hypothetical protein
MKFTGIDGLKLALKSLLLMAFIFYTNQGFAPRLEYLLETNNNVTLIVFFILWAFSIVVLLIVALQQKLINRIFWGAIIALVTAVSYGFYAAGGSELEVLDVLELWQARHETGRALTYFQAALIKAAIVALIGFVIIVLPPPLVTGKVRKYLSYLMWVPLLPVMIFIALIFIKSDRAVAGLPQQFVPLSIAGAITYKLSTNELPQRNRVSEPPSVEPKMHHLVYLVDESINPNYLYASKGKLLKGFSDNATKISNFGVAVSVGNCSARSNAMLRLGGTKDNLIQMIRTSPSIWQYAKKAGFRTIYIDAQDSSILLSKPNDFQNYMTSAEVAFIDKFYKIKDVEASLLDYKLLELIKTELENDEPTFIYANKNGAHFPYHNNYPKSEAIHQPVAGASEKHGLEGLAGLYKESGMVGVINTYKNSIHWTVDKFFRQFFEQINLDDTVVIYTSDHGQYFEPNSTTHCTSGDGAPATEGLVPLMLITSNAHLKELFSAAAKDKYNQADQFSIFPTVLNLLGYSDKIQHTYGTGLLESTIDTKKGQASAFNTGDIMGIISNDTIWREVSIQERIDLMPNIPDHPATQATSLLQN